MCPRCVVDPNLSRDRLCADSGVLLANLKSCHECQDQGKALQVKDRTKTEEEDGMEVIVYKHVCLKCGHEVAEHKHEFWVESGYQEYRMDCLLCGIGEDSVSVMPHDPRKASAYAES